MSASLPLPLPQRLRAYADDTHCWFEPGRSMSYEYASEIGALMREAADALEKAEAEVKQLDGKRLEAFALAEGTYYDMEGLKLGVRKFFDVIKTNIVDSPAFPEDMRFMAKMLLANQGDLLREIESETPKQIEGKQVIDVSRTALADDSPKGDGG